MSLTVDGIAFRYGATTVFSGLSFQVKAGTVCGLWGANGSGKSTLLRVIAGLLRPSVGRVILEGAIGYVPQEGGLYEELTVEENLQFFSRAHGASADGLLQRFGLESRGRQCCGELSHGWKQKLSLACAIAHRPRVLLLDEATSGLDAKSRDRMWTSIEEEASCGAAILISTHSNEDAARCGIMLRLESPE